MSSQYKKSTEKRIGLGTPTLTDWVNISKMSKIWFVDLDTSSDDDDVGSVLISKHEIQSNFDWWNSVGVSPIKQEIKETDADKDTKESKKAVYVQEKLAEDKEYSNGTHDTGEEMDNESEEINYKQGETDEKSNDVDKEHKEMHPIQKIEQPQEIENTDQQVEKKGDQKVESNKDEIEVTDIDRNFEGSTKDVHVATQYKDDQETEKDKQEPKEKDEPLDQLCGTGVTLIQENIILGEEDKGINLQHTDYRDQEKLTPPKNETTCLEVEVDVHEMSLQEVHTDDRDQEKSTPPENEMTHLEVEVEVHKMLLKDLHVYDKDQVNLTAAESEPTHSQVVTTESVEVHATLSQEVHIQHDQVIRPSTEIDTQSKQN